MSDGSIRIDTKVDNSGLDAGLRQTKAKLETAAGMLRDIMQGPVAAIEYLGQKFQEVGGAIADMTVGKAAQIQDFVAAFTPLTGSAENAKEMIAALNREAASTPFELTGIADVAKQLLPVLGNNVEAVTSTFRMLGDTAGGSAQKLDSITRGYVKALNSGKVTMEALNMISDAGVPIYTQLAKSMGVTVGQMTQMSSQSKITDKDLTKAFQDMTAEGGIFFKGMELASLTFNGKVSTMNDNLSQAGAVIGEELMPAAQELVDGIGGMAGDFIKWAKSGDNLHDSLQGVALALVTAASGLGAFLIATKGAAFVEGFTVAIRGLTLALLANPVVAVATAVSALVGAFVVLNGQMEETKKKQEGLFEGIAKSTGLMSYKVEGFVEKATKISFAMSKWQGSAEGASAYFDKLAKDSGLTKVQIAAIASKSATVTGILKEQAKIYLTNLGLLEDGGREAEKIAEATKETVKTSREKTTMLEHEADLRLEISTKTGQQNKLVEAGLKTERDALTEKISMRKKYLDSLEGEFSAGKVSLEFLVAETERINTLNSDNLVNLQSIDNVMQSMSYRTILQLDARMKEAGVIDEQRAALVDAAAKEATGQQIVNGYRAAALQMQDMAIDLEKDYQANLKKTAKTFEDIVSFLDESADIFASLSKSAAKFGNQDLAKILDGMAEIAKDSGAVATGLAKLAASNGADIGAWIQTITAGVALVADVWSTFWGGQSEAEKKAAEEARQAEKERLAAVHALESEYQAKFDSDIVRLQKERDERVAYAKRIGADVLQIEAYYAGEIEKVRRTTADISIEASAVEAQKASIKKKYDGLIADATAAARKAALATQTTVRYATGTIVETLEAALARARSDNNQVLVHHFEKQLSYETKRLTDAAVGALTESLRQELSTVVYQMQLFQERAQGAATGIGEALSKGLKEGVSAADFRTTILNMLRDMAIDAAIIASGFQEKFSAIGLAIAEAMKDGFQQGELDSISASIDQLYTEATASVKDINDMFASMGLDSAGAAPAGIVPASALGLPEPVAGGLSLSAGSLGAAPGVAPMASLGASTARPQILLQANGVLNVDGREIGRIAFQFSDENVGLAYA